MIQTTEKFISDNKIWHFHILTPDCLLNDTNKFALYLENSIDKQSLICYLDEHPLDLGKKLVKMLYGRQVLTSKYINLINKKKPNPDPNAKIIINKAKDMNRKNKGWHHHILFPGCVFNKHGNKYVLNFEDTENDQIIESVSNEIDDKALNQIEKEFYKQRTAK